MRFYNKYADELNKITPLANDKKDVLSVRFIKEVCSIKKQESNEE